MVKCLNSIVDYGGLRSVYSWTAVGWRGEGARCTRAAKCGCERKECKKQISRRNRPAPERRACRSGHTAGLGEQGVTSHSDQDQGYLH